MRRILLISSLALAVAAPASTLSAQFTTIGTSAPSTDFGPIGKDSQFGEIPTVFAQTFQAPTGSSYLQSFTLYLDNFINGDALNFNASIYAFSGDHIVGGALYSSGLFNGTNSITGPVPFAFGDDGANALNVFLNQGSTYAFVLSALEGYAQTPDGSTDQIGATINDEYANGALYFSTTTDGSTLSQSGGFISSNDAGGPPDAAFSADFTETAQTATPEPATMVLLATGLVGVGFIRRRQR